MRKYIFYILSLLIINIFLLSLNTYAKEYYGEGRRTYKCYVEIDIIPPGENTGKGATNYFLVNENGKKITCKWKYQDDFEVPVSVSYYNGYPEISVKPAVKKCLEAAAKQHTQVEITGKWMYAGEGTEGFDEQSVTCKKLP